MFVKKMLKCYVNNKMSLYESLNVSASGLVLNQNWPFLGASPDGVLTHDVLVVVLGCWRSNALISTALEQ